MVSRKLNKVLVENELLLVALMLIISFSLAIPAITIKIQSIGEGEPYAYYYPLVVYNNNTYDLTNYTVEITLTPQYVPAFSKVKINPFITDNETRPYYYWIMRANDQVITFFVRIPDIPAKSYVWVILWYGYYTNPFKQYDDPYKTFDFFYNFSSSTENWTQHRSGIFSSYQSPTLRISPDGLEISANLNANSNSVEDSIAYQYLLSVNQNYVIGASFKANSGSDYPVFMYIQYDYSVLWFNIPVYDYIAVTNSNGNTNITFGSNVGNSGQVASAKMGNWYYARIFVSPQYSYGDVQDYNSGKDLTGWKAFETSGWFSNQNVYFGFGQGLTSGSSFEDANIKWIYIRRVDNNPPLIYIAQSGFLLSYS